MMQEIAPWIPEEPVPIECDIGVSKQTHQARARGGHEVRGLSSYLQLLEIWPFRSQQK